MDLVLLSFVLCMVQSSMSGVEEDHGVVYANDCEVCKVVAVELEARLLETGKTREVIETGYSIDSPGSKMRKKYEVSELRLIESLEGICDRILEYNIHKERQDSNRFAKGMSQTFKTLHGLVDKGVKVELGIPYELWNKPSAEVTHLKTQCELLIESYEGDIEDWYFSRQGEESLKHFLCEERALRNKDKECLAETLDLKKESDASESSEVKKKKDKSKSKGDGGEQSKSEL